ncbi:MAG: acyl-CoA desaturase, partial [Actinoallomurus sp.]
MTVAPTATPSPASRPQARPDIEANPKGNFEKGLLAVFIVVPLLAVVAAVPFAWGWGLGWSDLAIMFVFYYLSGLGVTVGYHRHFTHGSFKAKRPLRIGLAIAGALSVEMSVIDWVAVHRRHHKYSDKEGDPHSPWLFGTSPVAVAKGFVHAHFGWLLTQRTTN